MKVRRPRCIIFDIEGVLLCGNTALPGASDTLAQLRSEGYLIGFLTNSSVKAPAELAAHLRSLGIRAIEDEVMSAGAAVGFRLRHRGLTGRQILTIGSTTLKQEILNSGNHLALPSDRVGDLVIVGFSKVFPHETLVAGQRAILAGAEFWTTDMDSVYPATPTSLMPGAAWVGAALAACTGRMPTIIGKPNPYSLRILLRRLGVSAVHTLLVGDNPLTDIACGRSAGCGTCLVGSGIPGSIARGITRSRLPRPDTFIPHIGDLYQVLDNTIVGP